MLNDILYSLTLILWIHTADKAIVEVQTIVGMEAIIYHSH